MSGRTGLEIAVIGLAGRFPGAKNVEELWRNLLGGVESIVRFTDEDLAAAGVPRETLENPCYVKTGAILEDADLLDAEFFSLTPREAEVIDPQHRLFLECAWEALESAGYDPETCGQSVGVYAGVSLSTYALLNVWPNRDRLESLGGLLGADKDHLTTLVSWKLNLGGPSLAVQAACSTSLVAVHLAARALLTGECGMALAGGASILFPQRSGYLWTEGGITSPDGRCRAFDAEARGTVFGNGVGAVVLKRLEDALADGDTVHAVIKGSAVNNDGGGRVGYTAPNLEGQRRVIQAAQRMAEVEPDTIGYVEAHGTGTSLGDPIEVAALAEAFRAGTDRAGFCALGSVKTNIGHLNAAAGVAGFIKAVLALKHRTVPPTLHFQRPNPRIDFASSPFFVNTEPLAWEGGEEPRRAAVSSFGMGGTNAHVILEEAPAPEPTTPSRSLQMLTLSARSDAALEAATDRLAAHLESHPEEDLADAAYTLHAGRRGFGYRRTVLARSREEAIRALAERDPRCVLTAAGGDREQPVFFLFPGQGSQYAGMARGLYEAEPVFQEEVDRCADLLRPWLGFDLRDVLFPSPGQAAAAAERLGRTAVTQPALFVVEHALAKLWMEWGVRPQGMIGHSVGEYVAACLAGVFSLEDALELVALRGRLIGELPGGAMLAVPLSEERVAPLLGGRLSLAAVNGPAMCVVSGSREEIERLRRRLQQDEPLLPPDLECRPLHTSHAFHSAAMEPILDLFAEGVRRIGLKAPSLPFVSNVTGTWITADEATDPAYWARHLRQTVRFAEGLRTLLAASPDGVLLEVGPGRTLTTLVRLAGMAGRPALCTLRHPQDAGNDQEILLRALGQLWLAGAPVDWRAYYARERRRRLPLPTYPFERRRYWIEPRMERAEEAERKEIETVRATVAAHHPRPSLGTACVPPRTGTEREIAAVWRHLFGIAEIGVHDDFFDLGGHSLLVTRMASRVRQALGVELPLQAFFEERTVAGLAALVERERRERVTRLEAGLEAPPLPRVPREGDLPLSFAQQRLWLLDRLAPGNPFYNLSGALRLTGTLDAGALGSALAEVVRRHEALRTGFASVDGRPVQRIEPAPGFALPVADLSGRPPGEREEEARRLAAEQARRPFDLGRPPLLRASLLRLGEAEHVLLYAMHHIVSDGWSMGVLTGEVARLYGAFAEGKPSPLPELPVQYADFAAWQRGWLQGEALERQLAYWQERMAGAPAVELPTDRPRPPVQSFRGATWRTSLSAGLSSALSALAREHGVSLFMVLLAGFDTLVSRYTGQEDLVVGTPVAGRTRVELEGLIGFFVNTLVLRTDLGGDPAVSEVLSRVRDTAVGAYAHQDLPFEHLVEKLQPQRDLSRNPLFQLMFNLLSAPAERVKAGDLSLSRLESPGGTALFDLQVYLTETEQGIATAWEYATDLFEAPAVERLAHHFATLLEGMVARPESRLSELPLLTHAERGQLLVEWNATGREVPGGCVHEWIAEQAARTPEAVAVVFGAESLTYRELDHRANGLARRLRSMGVGPEARVGVALERSLEMVVGLLAVLKAGGAYVPLDPSYPAERLALMLEDSGVAAVLTQESVRPGLPEHGGAWVPLSPGAREETELSRPPRHGAGPDNAAYVIYTSGSTGRPKGVQIPHRALANFLVSMAGRPGLGAQDALLAVTSLSFDIAGLELYLPLMMGGRVVLASREEAADGRRLQELIVSSGATVLQATPATWRLLLESDWQGGEGLKALCGGEALPPALAANLLERVGSLWNVYGPTETTVWSTVEEIRAGGPISIGGPIANTEAYVLDGRGNPVPVGAAGELYLGGAGLARGYLGRPELTAEKFVPNPFGDLAGRAGSRLYRTGDLARYRADGRLECLGRIDHQVKVRGFRIELGEIEAALCRHSEVAAAVVVAREDAPGDRRLVAYVVQRRPGVDRAGELRAWVRQSLPEYMVPSAWVALETLPLTPNGKVDRKALPAPAVEPRDSTAPRTPTEEVLAGVWAQVLGVGTVGAEDSFFDLGGHSLLAAQVVSRVREAFGVELPLRRIFEAPTLAGLAGEIDSAMRADRGVQAPPLRPVPRDGDLPLSFAQERFWFLDRLQPGSTAYNMPAAFRLRGGLDVHAFRRTLWEIVRRHESLRTRFTLRDGGPVQVIEDPRLEVPVVDLRALPAARREAALQRLSAEEARRPFDLATGPLLRVTLLRSLTEAGESESAVLLTMHHAVSDVWSMSILLREMAALYGAFAAGRASPLAELPVQYADFACWQRQWLAGAALEEQIAYWRRHLQGAPPLLELPTDRPRPALQRVRGRQHRWLPPAGLAAALHALCRREGTTLFMGLLAAFQGLLQRYSGCEDVIVGTPVAGRNLLETETLIGPFLNNLVLRVDLSGNPDFRQRLARTREVTLGAYAHQDLPFEKLVEELAPERNLSHSPLFQVMLILQNAPGATVEMPGLALVPVEAAEAASTAKFDLTLTMAETPGGLAGVLVYDGDLFEAATTSRMLGHFQVLLGGVVEHPELPLLELPLLTAAEEEQLLGWNDTAVPYPAECLHELIEAQVERTPERVAVCHEGRSLTYRELNTAANRLAHHLLELGVGPEDRVGICAERSPEMLLAVLAVLKAGGAYVPLDPGHPRERLAHVLRDAGATVLLTQESVAGRLPDLLASVERVVLLDRDGEEIRRRTGENPPPLPLTAGMSGRLAYVIYTSGSTGQPKGVQIPHRALVNFLASMKRQPGLAEDGVLLAVTTLSFDIAGLELFLPLLTGARIVLAPAETVSDGAALARLLKSSGATVMQATPATWRLLLDSGWQGDPGLRVLCGGEALPRDLAERLLGKAGSLWNLYGPTETTVWSTAGLVRHGEGPVPLGGPIANTGIHLLDGALDGGGQPVPAGVPGELFIGGDGVARGYLGRPALTAERFVPDPFASEPGARMYRTGDLVRRRADGALEFLGRTDFQIKVRGFRIEPGEIEAQLGRLPGVREAIVLARGDNPGDKRLVAYVTPDPEAGEAPAAARMRSFLKERLPAYMVPAAFVVLDHLPVTPNGKADRKALLKIDDRRQGTDVGYRAPGTEAEKAITSILQEVLKIERVGVDHNFFELGANSLLLVQVNGRLQERFGREILLVEIFNNPTVRALAAHLEGARAPQPVEFPSRDRSEQLRQGRDRLRRRFEQQKGYGKG